MLCSSDLRKEVGAQQEKGVLLTAAQLREYYRGSKTRVLIGEMAYQDHSRHLVLPYDASKRKFLGGLFFHRPGKQISVSAAYLDHETDCIELLVTFFCHLRKAAEVWVADNKYASPRRTASIEDFMGGGTASGNVFETYDLVQRGLGGRAKNRIMQIVEDIRELGKP